MKYPLIRRKIHKEILKNMHIRSDGLEHRISELRCELDTANEVIDKVLPRLVKINVSGNFEFKTWRICAELHRDMVERAFTHGGDDREIRHIAERVAHEIKRKIISYNFARCDKE